MVVYNIFISYFLTSIDAHFFMQGIRDHPGWDVFLTYDGFKSHVNVTDGLETLTENTIQTVKKEAGISQLYQSCDQHQAN